ncbi:MAG: Crp/Fnr family transcriptional regulator [Chakrabartia godavariana]
MNDAAQEKRLSAIRAAFACSDEIARVIDGLTQLVHTDPDGTILYAGESAPYVFLLLQGRAQAVVYSAQGQLVLLDTYAEGDLFGEVDIVGTTTAWDQVIAVTAVDSGRLRQQDFVMLLESHPSLAMAVLRQVTARLSRTARRMVERSTLSATGRIYAELLRQAGEGDGRTIRPVPTMTELALIVQSTRETVSRTINDLERRGYITRDKDALMIVAPHRVQELII